MELLIHAELLKINIEISLQYILFLHTDMTQVVEILPRRANLMVSNDLATQGARASAAMILTQLNCDNSVPTRQGLTLNVRGPSYIGLTKSISWLLIPWLLMSPGHQQP